MTKVCPICGREEGKNLASHVREAHKPEDFGLTGENNDRRP